LNFKNEEKGGRRGGGKGATTVAAFKGKNLKILTGLAFLLINIYYIKAVSNKIPKERV